MSRLTGKEAFGLMEAYQAVYAPRELTEEQVWEGVENWVNSLLEEGYDLSDYTWNEMYEAYNYINEQMSDVMPGGSLEDKLIGGTLAAGFAGLSALKDVVDRNVPVVQNVFNTKKLSPEELAQRKAAREARKDQKLKDKAIESEKNTNLPSPTTDPVKTVKPVETVKPSSLNSGGRAELIQKAEAAARQAAARQAAAARQEAARQEAAAAQKAAAAAQKAAENQTKPGFLERLRQAQARIQADKSIKRKTQPGPVDYLKQTAADYTARGLDKVSTGVKRGLTGSGIAGVAGLMDQGFMGGVVGKSARDFTNFTKQAGPTYDRLMGRSSSQPTDTPKNDNNKKELVIPRGYKMVDGKIVKIEEGVDYGYKSGIPGLYDQNGKLVKKLEDLTPEQVSDYEKKYRRIRGPRQIDVDNQVQRLERKKQDDAKKTTAQRATQQRLEAGVVQGGEAGFKSIVPKPTPQKGESAEKFKARQSRYEDSQRLAQTLTQSQQKKAAQKAAEAEAEKAKNPPVKIDPPVKKPAPVPPTQQQPKPTQQQPKPGSVLRNEPLWDGPGDSSPKPQAQTGDRTKDLTTWANANKNMINTVGTPQQKAILSAAEKGTAMPAPRPISNDIEDIKRMQTASRDRQGVKESYDAYDLVLEYLLSQGHTDTIEEANYVMMEMDEEIIGNIIDHYIIE